MTVVERETKVPHADCAIEGTASTLAAICGEEPTWVSETSEPPQPRDISGVIAIVGQVSWSLIFSFPEATACAFAERFAGIAIPFDSPDMADVIGEFANVVAGDVVCRLEGRRVKAELAIPTVARGAGVRTTSPAAKAVETARFTLPDGNFWLEVAAA